jgi:hypothetical protein
MHHASAVAPIIRFPIASAFAGKRFQPPSSRVVFAFFIGKKVKFQSLAAIEFCILIYLAFTAVRKGLRFVSVSKINLVYSDFQD